MQNIGNGNAGYWNIGNRNAGNRNAGDGNARDGNTGNRNAGDGNTGDWNAGDGNTGDGNTGDWNAGYGNAGSWNAGDGNTGYFNIDEPKVRIFGKETDIKREDLKFPHFCYFSLTEWIYESDMTKKEKETNENEYYKITGGYLKSYGYKEAFLISYNKLSEGEKKKQIKILKELPNFNSQIFKKISGIDIEETIV